MAQRDHKIFSIRSSRKGQSMIEAIVAISMLTVGFLGILTLLTRSFFLSRITSDQLVATYLASEGIEVTKNLIDHDVYEYIAGQGTGWGTCFAGRGTTLNIELDYSTTDCTQLLTFIYPGDKLMYDPVTHLYGYNLPLTDGSTYTNFTRDIRITLNGNEIIVDSIVNWSTGTVTAQSLDLEDHFYNWHP